MREAPATKQIPGWTSCVQAFELEFEYLHRAVLRLGVRGADAEDLVQDVFVVMWRRRADYQPDRPLRPWLVGIAAHLAQRHKKRRGREVPAAQLEAPDEAPLAEERLVSASARALVLGAMAKLPARHRVPLVMHDIDGLSIAQISARLSIPLATAYTRLRRARLAFASTVKTLQVMPAPRPVRRRALILIGWLSVAALTVVGALGLVADGLAPQSGPRPALEHGLVGYWRLDDEPAGSKSVGDRSANGNDCTVHGVAGTRAFTEGPLGPALMLGSRNWLQCPQPAAPASGATAMTAAAWIHPTALRKFHGAVVARALPDGHDHFQLAVFEDDLVVHSDAWDIYLRRPLGSLHRWTHVAFTRASDGRTRLFIGGVPVGEATGRARGQGTVTAPLLVGAAAAETTASGIKQRFYGAMDELVIYDRALAEHEIAALAGGAQPQR